MFFAVTHWEDHMTLKIRIKPGKFAEQEKGNRMRTLTMRRLAKFGLLVGCLIFAGATLVVAQENSPSLAQVVALDECDPTTFNAALGPDFCKNVTLGAFTVLSDLFRKAQAGTPDPGWDFEPDTLRIKEGTTVNVVDQGGEPHTFTEVAHFGGGFVSPLNTADQASAPACAGGVAKQTAARTSTLQGTPLQVTCLSKGEHSIQSCIH